MTPFDFDQDLYQTAPRSVSWFARRFPTLAYYPRFLGIVFRAGAMAKQGKYDDQAWTQSSWAVLRALERVGVQFEIRGIQNIARLQSPCLVIGNHMSTLETTVLPGVIRPHRKLTYVVKASLLDVPVFKHVMRSRDPIVVGRTDPRKDLRSMLDGGVERLENGTSIIIFPQGERTTSFDPRKFNSIGVKLAQRAKVPIIPMALQTNAWRIGKHISDFGRIDPTKKVRIAFDRPMEVHGRGTDEQNAIIKFIDQQLKAWQNLETQSRP